MKKLPLFLTDIPIAHRGLHDDTRPENSLPAFSHAIEKGYAIELDLHLLKDGNVVVFHDDDLFRAVGVNKKIKDLTLKEVKNYRIFNSNEKIPTFTEVLGLVAGRVGLLIEFKVDRRAGELERIAVELLKEYKGDYAVQSFNPLSVKWFKDNAPDIARGQLSSFFYDVKLAWWKKFLVKTLKLNLLCNPDFVSYEHIYLPNQYLDKIKLPKLAWVVRSEDEHTRIKDYVDNIIFEDYMPKID